MCTLTWLRQEDELNIWFNRDEQTLRAEAIPPQLLNWQGVKVIAPIDPPSAGTWICSNEFGVSVALLNWYLQPASDGKISRGQLVKSLSQLTSLDELSSVLESIDFRVFAPFQCAIFDRFKQCLLCWNGEQLSITEVPEILTSSSVETLATINRRKQQFQQFQNITASRDDFFSFHQQHDCDFPSQSVCVHRELSRTMSHTQIQLTTQTITMRYFSGYPCDITSTTTPSELVLSVQESR